MAMDGNTKSIYFRHKCLEHDEFLYVLTKDKSVGQHNSTSHLNFTSVDEDLTIVTQNLVDTVVG